MKRSTGLVNRLTMAALVSALAAVLVVAVGPGFAEQPEDAGTPNENASEQAVEATADDSAPADEAATTASEDGASEEAADLSATETDADAGASEEALADAENGNKPDVPPGQADAEDAAADQADVTANGNAVGQDKINEDTSQTGLPRGQEEDECTNKHDTDDAAEFPGNGANKHGLYDDTCDGRASENGSGGGNATGRPCMGCVGNADDKNPPGQSPQKLGGKDHNAGYECDRNKGVGQGNPAHTDCSPTDIIYICHSDDGEDFDVIAIERQEWYDEHIDHEFDSVVGPETDPEDCEEEEPPCKNHCDEEFCPADSDKPGHKIPPGHTEASFCYKDKEKVWICHATGSANNPYVVIHVSVNAWTDNDGHGHAGHAGDFEVPAGTDKADCSDEEEDEVFVCHSLDGDTWSVEGPMSEDEADDDHLTPHDFDFEVDEGTSAADCEEEEDDEVFVCHSLDGDNWSVEGPMSRDDADDDHLDIHSRDFLVDEDTDASDCDEDERRRPSRLTICHSTDGDNWSVLTLSRSEANRHLREDSLDKVVSRGTSPSECEDETELCPPGSDLEGRPMPEDGVCDVAQTEGGLFCPKNSDLAGMPVPNGNMVNCYEDEVLAELEQRPGVPPANLPGRPPTDVRGGLLPFTGASVLAFLVLALQLIAAGSLILRGKRA